MLAFLTTKDKIIKFVLDNEFNNAKVRNYLDQEEIQYHFTIPNGHTSRSDIERFTEKNQSFQFERKFQ